MSSVSSLPGVTWLSSYAFVRLMRAHVDVMVHWDSSGEVGGVGDLFGVVDLLGDVVDVGPVVDGD